MVPVPWIVLELVSALMVPLLTIPERFDFVPRMMPELANVVIVEASSLYKLPISKDVLHVPVVSSVPELVRLFIVAPLFKIPWALDVMVPTLVISMVPVVSWILMAASSIAVESLQWWHPCYWL